MKKDCGFAAPSAKMLRLSGSAEQIIVSGLSLEIRLPFFEPWTVGQALPHC
jgi:hypothetical protein